MRRPIINNTSPGDAVYEPFLGSGTTLIAAESVGRICFAVELSPAYVDVGIRRWQAFTGKKAIRQSNGQEFDEVSSGEGS
jgi:DNA modification methylase